MYKYLLPNIITVCVCIYVYIYIYIYIYKIKDVSKYTQINIKNY